MRRKTPGPIWSKFCTGGDAPDVITCAKFGDDRLTGLSVAMGQILGFSIGFRRRPYNTLALPCECVITDADGSRVSTAIIHVCDSVCDSVCLSVCLTAR